MNKNVSLYWRLSGFYFFFFAITGVFGPYWSLYLKSIGFDASDIGELTAIYVGGSFFAPYLWAWLADRSGKSILLIRIASVLSILTFSGVLIIQSFWLLALLLCVFSILLNGVLPQLEANTLNHAGDENQHYGNVRLWGSVGFVVTSIVLGEVLESTSISILPATTLILVAVAALMTFFIPQQQRPQHPPSGQNILELLARPIVIAFFGAAFMMFVGYSPYIIFFSIHLENNAYGHGTIGWLWALGMLAEIGAFFIMPYLFRSYSFKTLLLAAYVLTSLRWLLIAFYIDNFVVMIFAQTLQAATIGVYHTVSIHVIHLLFQGKYQYRGQALYVCVTGSALVCGILGSGYLWEHFPASLSFSLAALATMIAFLITWQCMEDLQNKPNALTAATS